MSALSELDREFKNIEYFTKFNKYGNVLDFVKLVLPIHDYNSILNKVELYVDTLLKNYDIDEKAEAVLNSGEVDVHCKINGYIDYKYTEKVLKYRMDERLRNLDVEINSPTLNTSIFKGEWENLQPTKGTLIQTTLYGHDVDVDSDDILICTGEFKDGELIKGKSIDKKNSIECNGDFKNKKIIKGIVKKNGCVLYDGEWDENRKFKGRIFASDGVIYEGEQDENGVAHCTMKSDSIQEGTMSLYGDKKTIKVVYKNGDIHEGDCIAGKFIGKKTWPDVGVANGVFEAGNIINGTITYFNGDIETISGDFIDNILTKGTYVFKTGKLWEGEMERLGMKNFLKRGILTCENGIVFTGEFELDEHDNVLLKNGYFTMATGEICKGEMKHVYLDSDTILITLKKGSITHVDGTIVEGEWNYIMEGDSGKYVLKEQS